MESWKHDFTQHFWHSHCFKTWLVQTCCSKALAASMPPHLMERLGKPQLDGFGVLGAFVSSSFSPYYLSQERLVLFLRSWIRDLTFSNLKQKLIFNREQFVGFYPWVHHRWVYGFRGVPLLSVFLSNRKWKQWLWGSLQQWISLTDFTPSWTKLDFQADLFLLAGSFPGWETCLLANKRRNQQTTECFPAQPPMKPGAALSHKEETHFSVLGSVFTTLFVHSYH